MKTLEDVKNAYKSPEVLAWHEAEALLPVILEKLNHLASQGYKASYWAMITPEGRTAAWYFANNHKIASNEKTTEAILKIKLEMLGFKFTTQPSEYPYDDHTDLKITGWAE